MQKHQYPLMIKTFYTVDVEGTSLTIIKIIYDKPIGNITLNSEKLTTFPVNSRQECPLLPLLFNIVLEVLTTVIREERQKKLSTTVLNAAAAANLLSRV